MKVFVVAAAIVNAAVICMALPSVVSAQSSTISVDAGPIWSQSDAEKKCPDVAKAKGGTWTGQWRTTVPGQMSVCEVRLTPSNGIVKTIDAGPIWSQSDAEKKCPAVARTNGGTWNGQWRTTVPGQMSVCEVRISSSGTVVKTIDAGPIWSQSDAEKKCPEVAKSNGGTWNGQWRTTVPGKMSVCEVRMPAPKG
jgi:Mannan-binding protein